MSVYNLDDSKDELPPKIRDKLLYLHRLDTEFAHLELKLNDTRMKRDAVYRQLELFCELKAPIRRMPCEVLAIIFDNHPEVQESRNSALMRVCKAWCQIVMDTPRLWSHISLVPKKIEELPSLWKYARRCLLYSGELPLYVHLDAQDLDGRHSFLKVGECLHGVGYDAYIYTTGSSSETSLRPFIDYCELEWEEELVKVHECAMLMTLAILRGENDRFISRWRTFRFYPYTPLDGETAETMGARLWDSVDGVTDKLVDLEFSPYDSNNGDWYPTGFPNLKSLKGFSTRLDVNLERMGLPAATLERLILLVPDTSPTFFNFLPTTFRLLRLLELNFISSPVHKYEQAMHLPALEVLALHGGQYERILDRFHAPKLTHLSLDHLPPAGSDPPSILNTVTDVMWDVYKGRDSSELVRLLALTPSLRRIHVRRHKDAGDDPAILKTRPDVYCTEDVAEWPYIIPVDGF